MSKKYFIISDVHSFYDEMLTALADAGFDINNPEHILVNLGDIFDRGPNPRACLKFVNDLPDDRKILIRGNHEDLMEEAICRKCFKVHDYHNKTNVTALDLSDLLFTQDNDLSESHVLRSVKRDEDYNKYIKSTIDYYEDDHCIFVHGWIPSIVPVYQVYEYDPDWRVHDWHSARWINGMGAWSKGVKEKGKTIFCGHWHTSWGHSFLHNDGPEFDNKFSTNPEHHSGAKFTPFIDDGICAIDACTALTHKVNCVVVDVDTGEILSQGEDENEQN